MTALEQQILDTIQDAFPLEERPYKALADKFSAQGEAVTEQQVFEAVEILRISGVIRRIGGIYDSRRLGFISRLCAGKVADIDKFAATVNEIPAITHNYVRSHEYNVWFTVIAENEAEVQKIVDALCAKTDLQDVHVLTVTKKFKIDTVMTRGPRRMVAAAPVAHQSRTLDLSDRARIRVACTDIPHTLTPYADWGVSVEELRGDIASGFMRRFGAILRHQQAGFAFNAMVCFCTDESGSAGSPIDKPKVTELVEVTSKDLAGDILAKNPHVSHCYERPAFEGFPYNLYAMMHAQSAEDLDCFIKEAAQSIGNPDYAVLHSVRELKKTSFQFFA